MTLPSNTKSAFLNALTIDSSGIQLQEYPPMEIIARMVQKQLGPHKL